MAMTLRRPARQQAQRLRAVQPLGRDVQEVEVAGEVRLLDRLSLGRGLGRIEVRRPHAVGDEGVDLVVHERDERTHHQAGARTYQGRHLVRDALAAAGRHEHDGVAAVDHALDDVGLIAAERVVAVDLVQDLAGIAPVKSRTSGSSRAVPVAIAARANGEAAASIGGGGASGSSGGAKRSGSQSAPA